LDERKAFSFYRSYYEASKDLPTKEDQADFLMAICSYIFDGVEPEITGVASAMFKLAKPNLETSIKRANAGQIGGSSNKKENKVKANDKQNESKTEANDKQSESQAEAINDYMINDYMINEKEKINKKEKPAKHQHGKYKNVLLSDDELEELKKEFPVDWQERIERVSEYCASKGRAYKNYLATIRAWARKDGDAKPQKKESLEEMGARINAEVEKRRAEGKSKTMEQIKAEVEEKMRREGKLNGTGNTT
jgi:hypothetical protein